MKREISYADLARAAKEIGNRKAFWRAWNQHVRVKRKQWANQKAAALTATR